MTRDMYFYTFFICTLDDLLLLLLLLFIYLFYCLLERVQPIYRNHLCSEQLRPSAQGRKLAYLVFHSKVSRPRV